MTNKQSFIITEIAEQKIWSLAEVKNYLRISNDYDDALLKHLLETSVAVAENFIGKNLTIKKIIMKSIDKYTKHFALKYWPIVDIQKVTVKNNEVETELNATDYTVCKEKVALYLLKNFTRTELKVDFMVGTDEKTLSPAIKQGLLIHTCQMYERQDGQYLPMEAKNLYAPYRAIRV